jgi:hypothetical protein
MVAVPWHAPCARPHGPPAQTPPRPAGPWGPSFADLLQRPCTPPTSKHRTTPSSRCSTFRRACLTRLRRRASRPLARCGSFRILGSAAFVESAIDPIGCCAKMCGPPRQSRRGRARPGGLFFYLRWSKSSAAMVLRVERPSVVSLLYELSEIRLDGVCARRLPALLFLLLVVGLRGARFSALVIPPSNGALARVKFSIPRARE